MSQEQASGHRARYDDVADEYEQLMGTAANDPATAALLQLLGAVGRRRVLDLPCGEGRVARELARRGAQVVGVDLSTAMLDKARAVEASEPLGIAYVQADATSPDALAGELFDAVVCNFGLSDIDDLDGALATFARVLRPDGPFVFSILHPCFPGMGSLVAADWPPDGGYYHEGWWRTDAEHSDLRRRVGSNHRMVSTYLNALVQHGLVLEQVAEPAPAWDFPDVVPVPMFLVARCRAIART